jgi:hypothetical protein
MAVQMTTVGDVKFVRRPALKKWLRCHCVKARGARGKGWLCTTVPAAMEALAHSRCLGRDGSRFRMREKGEAAARTLSMGRVVKVGARSRG